MRPKHYVKNGLILLPLFFGNALFHAKDLRSALLGFAAFSLLASVVYIINDVRDCEKDRRHPTKCDRPVASGRVPVFRALCFAVVLGMGALCLQWLTGTTNSIATVYLILYFLLNLAYSLGCKNVPLLDIVILASGFLLRVLYGGAVCSIPVSQWLCLMVMTFSLYMGLGKRRGEINGSSGEKTRDVLQFYPVAFLDKSMNMCMSLTLMFYSLWAMSLGESGQMDHNPLLWTVPVVIVICLRYSMLIEKDSSDGDPTEVFFKDKVLLLLCIFYILFMFFLFYFS